LPLLDAIPEAHPLLVPSANFGVPLVFVGHPPDLTVAPFLPFLHVTGLSLKR